MTVSAHSTVLVGREADLAALHEALKRVRGGEPSTVLIGGEAGVGKTRLIEEFSRSLDGEAVRVLHGQCLELGEEGLPFAPFAAALRELTRREGPAVFGGREAEFARLLPELGSPPALGESRRGHLFDLVGALFTRLAEEQPVLLLLEDLHWADRSTRDLIGYLLRAVRAPRLLVVGTFRTDELHRGHPLRPFLAELDRVRGVQRLELDRLDRDGTAELLGHLLGGEPDAPTVDAVCERAQGIPFFIEQFASSADPRCGDIPETLRDLLLSRVDQLTEDAQRVLRVAAVGGIGFGHELLARVAGMDEAALESALRAAVAAQLIVFDPDGGYEFRHALVREAVHDDLLPGEHARLHARYAQIIESEPRLVAPDRAPAEIAHHWHAAHDHPRALVAARRAADSASCRYAYAEQARLLDRVLELWEQVPDAAALLGTTHLDLLEETALAAIDSGDHLRALSLTRAALGDLDCEAEPTRAARLLIRRANLLRNAGKSDGAAETREAYRLLARAPRDLTWLKLLGDVAYQMAAIDGAEAERIARQVRSAAAEFGDEAAQVAADITFGQVCGGRLAADEALPAMRRAVERARASGDVVNFTHGLVNLSDSLFELGRYAESAAAAAEGIPLADRAGVSRTTGVYLLVNCAEALMALGRWDEADTRLAEAARQDPPGTLAVAWLRLRARIRLARGHDGAAALTNRAIAFLAKPFLTAAHRLTLLELQLTAADPGHAAAASWHSPAAASWHSPAAASWHPPAAASWHPPAAAEGRHGVTGAGHAATGAGRGHASTGAGREHAVAGGGVGHPSVGSGVGRSSAGGGVGRSSAGGGVGRSLAGGGVGRSSAGGGVGQSLAGGGAGHVLTGGGASAAGRKWASGGAGLGPALTAARTAVHDRGIFERPRYGWPLLVAAARVADDALRAEIRTVAARLPAHYPAEKACAAEVAAWLDGGAARWHAAVAAWRADGQPYQLARALLSFAEAVAADGAAVEPAAGTRRAANAAAAPGSPPSGVGGAAADRAAGTGAGGAAADRAAGTGAGRAAADPVVDAGAAADRVVGAGAAADRGAATRVAAHRAAAEALTEAMELADGLGAVRLVEAADVLARRLGLRPGGGDVPGQEVLTAREREVLRLVAEGHSNSRIARELFISPKTASVHVSRIIAKLEVSNRVEAAAVARRLGLLQD